MTSYESNKIDPNTRQLTRLGSKFVLCFGLLCLSGLAQAQIWGSFDPNSCSNLDANSMRPALTTVLNPCTGKGTVIFVATSAHQLYLCEAGGLLTAYDVALGVAGTGKKAEGDRKTPLGRYDLAQPRPSDLFGLFILLDFPTEDQVLAGITGSAIGIHGPQRPNQCEGLANVASDWTDGCIAVANDVFIDEIGRFVVSHPKVHLLVQ